MSVHKKYLKLHQASPGAGESAAGAGAGALHGPKTKEIVNGTSITTRGKAPIGSIN